MDMDKDTTLWVKCLFKKHLSAKEISVFLRQPYEGGQGRVYPSPNPPPCSHCQIMEKTGLELLLTALTCQYWIKRYRCALITHICNIFICLCPDMHFIQLLCQDYAKTMCEEPSDVLQQSKWNKRFAESCFSSLYQWPKIISDVIAVAVASEGQGKIWNKLKKWEWRCKGREATAIRGIILVTENLRLLRYH